MKSLLNTVLPAMALLALGGCASTSALTTTESDGVYYSSKDRTTYNAPASATASVQRQEPQPAAADDETNPDYTTSSSSKSSAQSGGSEYYDDDYGYSARIRRFHQPVYRGFGYGYNDFIYADPFWYGGSPYAYYGGGYSPYNNWGPGFYDPFYGPYYGGSALVINIGFGRPYYNPWRYGYGGFGYGYGGGYGGYRSGYYDGYHNGLSNGYGSGYYGGGGTRRNVQYGPRGSRSLEATTKGGTAGSGRSRTREGGTPAPTGDIRAIDATNGATPAWNGRSRPQATSATSGSATDVRTGRSEQVLRRDAATPDGRVRQAEGREAGEQPRTPETGGRRWRVVENAGDAGSQPATAPTYSEPRRGRVREASSGERTSEQNTSEQAVEQPIRRQRSAPAQRVERREAPQRTYEAPQRSYEAPSRSSSEPSRSSSPASGGGRSGGGRGRGE
ncbi:hypothetical protein [Hymenobacter elongatus]|uniref:Prolyl-tRNA synthetase n=1 Tax=Hymenobacter elongatus TaxID=877208 RepID=A0A4Z0PJD6_9BACT|nr:hypothetical protein [Hymenobacter elongatus]TGE15664.1 hypothetical protein E5J99_11810 [Hymenobacter elongatus]